MTTLKRTAVGLVLTAMLVAAAACGGTPNPEAMVQALLNDFQAGNFEAVAGYAEDPEAIEFEALGLTDLEDLEELEEFQEWLESLVEAFLAQLNWQIDGSQVASGGQTATVTATITAPDVGELVVQFFVELLMAIVDPAADLEDVLDNLLAALEAEGEDALPRHVETVEVHLVLVENEWRVASDEANEAFVNALLGNLLAVLEGLEEQDP